MLDIRKGATLHIMGSQKEPSSPRKLFAFVGGFRGHRDVSTPEEAATFKSVLSKDLGDLTISYKKTFGSKGVRTLRSVVDSESFTQGKSKADPQNDCYAGQQYSVPFSTYFMRSALLHNYQELDETMKDNLYLRMCDDIISGPTRGRLKDIENIDSDDPNFQLFPPQSLIESICSEPREKLANRSFTTEDALKERSEEPFFEEPALP